MKRFLILLLALCFFLSFAVPLAAATPNLVVTAGSAGLAPSLTITSDSKMPWKQFVLSGGSGGSYQIVWAESSGTSGGIYFGSIAVTAGGPSVTPPAPAPDLPIDTLQTAAAAAVTGIAAADAGKMADTYESLAASIDKGLIVSPLQLQLATGTQLLANFNAAQLDTFKNFTAAVSGWLDAQQCAGRLTPMDLSTYSQAYHAIAAAIRPKATASSHAATRSSCADGHCPLPESVIVGRRRR